MEDDVGEADVANEQSEDYQCCELSDLTQNINFKEIGAEQHHKQKHRQQPIIQIHFLYQRIIIMIININNFQDTPEQVYIICIERTKNMQHHQINES